MSVSKIFSPTGILPTQSAIITFNPEKNNSIQPRTAPCSPEKTPTNFFYGACIASYSLEKRHFHSTNPTAYSSLESVFEK